MYFSKDSDSVPTFESPWIHRGWTLASGARTGYSKVSSKEQKLPLEHSLWLPPE